MKLNTKNLLTLLTVCIITGVPLVVGAQYDVARGQTAANLESTPISLIIETVLLWLLLIFTFIAVIGFVISGIMFITAGGSARAEEAKKWLTYSIIGIVIALSGYIVLAFVTDILQGLVI